MGGKHDLNGPLGQHQFIQRQKAVFPARIFCAAAVMTEVACMRQQTAKIGSLLDVQESKDPDGLRIFYYLVQVTPRNTHSITRTCAMTHTNPSTPQSRHRLPRCPPCYPLRFPYKAVPALLINCPTRVATGYRTQNCSLVCCFRRRLSAARLLLFLLLRVSMKIDKSRSSYAIPTGRDDNILSPPIY